MKKKLKILLVAFCILLVLALLFFVVDFIRAKQEKSPLFCVPTFVYRDGGTQEYLGLGYKVIAYHKVNGYTKVHIGTWFLDYDEDLTGMRTSSC